MEKQRSFKNQTLQLTAEEQLFWQKKLLHLQEPVTEATILNRTINGDLMEMVDYLPKSFADLIIIDPPYNLHKDFAGMKFKQMSNAEYLEYLDSWFPKIVDLLKP
ncbi:MAG: site-specific DNA-methyltransferase, partial [Candidatus Symbiothrix sp.]|nr:site-specific DNA-methyltransferase [Candidatus Symbiothrix sp.]